MKLAQAVIVSIVAAVTANPVPTPTLQDRATTFCGDWDSVTTGYYTVYQNLWGKSAATSGSQCTTLNSGENYGVAWSTSWTWAGGSSSVKSYANAGFTMSARQVSGISSIPSQWYWYYSGSSIVANVAYDLFTSSTSSGSAAYEIMIWLAAIGGAGPISSTGSPVSTPSIGGISWNLYKGTNGAMTVFSFVATSQQASYSGDLRAFITYLASNQGFPTSQYLKSVQAGTEPFTGSNAVLNTYYYTVNVI